MATLKSLMELVIAPVAHYTACPKIGALTTYYLIEDV
jgi:hypothetical protein